MKFIIMCENCLNAVQIWHNESVETAWRGQAGVRIRPTNNGGIEIVCMCCESGVDIIPE